MNKVDKLVSKIDVVLSLPMVVDETIKLCSDPNCNAVVLSRVVSKDPVLAAKLLKTANSSFFGFMHKTSRIESAIVRLGIKRVRNITLSLGVGKLFSSAQDKDGYSALSVWQHSVAVGIMCEIFTTVSSLPNSRQFSGEALLAGLVHDMGMILEDQYVPHKFTEIPAYSYYLKEPVYKVEDKTLGFNHADLGSAILKSWRFPAQIVDAVAGHHKPDERTNEPLTQLVAMAELLVSAQKIGFSDIPEVDRSLFGRLQQRLGLIGPAIQAVKQNFSTQLEEALQIFTVE